MPISGPLKVIERVGKGWRLGEVKSKKTYLVHSDYIVVSPAPLEIKRMHVTNPSSADSMTPQVGSVSATITVPAEELNNTPVVDLEIDHAPIEVTASESDRNLELSTPGNSTVVSEPTQQPAGENKNATRIQPMRQCKK